jgi:hypothetical protein
MLDEKKLLVAGRESRDWFKTAYWHLLQVLTSLSPLLQ